MSSVQAAVQSSALNGRWKGHGGADGRTVRRLVNEESGVIAEDLQGVNWIDTTRAINVAPIVRREADDVDHRAESRTIARVHAESCVEAQSHERVNGVGATRTVPIPPGDWLAER